MTSTEPQIWVLIGVFAAATASIITMVLLTMRAQLDRMQSRMDTAETRIRSEMHQSTSGIHSEMRARFSGLHTEKRAMQGDVTGLYRHTFGDPPSHGLGTP